MISALICTIGAIVLKSVFFGILAATFYVIILSGKIKKSKEKTVALIQEKELNR
jgi:hypothetical protein